MKFSNFARCLWCDANLLEDVRVTWDEERGD